MKPIWRQSLTFGATATQLDGIVATLADKREHPHGSFSGTTTAILGAATPRLMKDISKSVATWTLANPIRQTDTWAQGYVVVACIRRFGGCHSSVRGQKIELFLNEIPVDWFKLEIVPPGHDDYFYRPEVPGIPRLKEVAVCQTIYAWPITRDKLLWDLNQTLRITAGKRVRWDIDYVGIIIEAIPQPDFEIALSFAGEDRVYVEQVASMLKARGVTVFYDIYEQANLWGEDLYEHLIDVYKERAKYSVIFISEHYGRKLWAQLERRAAQARAFVESQGYILPARFDNTEIPGLLPTTGYIDINKMEPETLVDLIIKKLRSKSDA
jgi:hypothetical protein